MRLVGHALKPIVAADAVDAGLSSPKSRGVARPGAAVEHTDSSSEASLWLLKVSTGVLRALLARVASAVSMIALTKSSGSEEDVSAVGQGMKVGNGDTGCTGLAAGDGRDRTEHSDVRVVAVLLRRGMALARSRASACMEDL